MADRLSETEITVAVARYLGVNGWRIVSMALPGGGSGVAFNPSQISTRGVSPGAIIPDLIGQHQRGDFLLVESKPRPNVSDAIKLRELLTDDYKDSVERILGSDCIVHLGAAFGPRSLRDMKTSLEVQSLLGTGFEIGEGGDVVIPWDESGLLVRNLDGA